MLLNDIMPIITNCELSIALLTSPNSDGPQEIPVSGLTTHTFTPGRI